MFLRFGVTGLARGVGGKSLFVKMRVISLRGRCYGQTVGRLKSEGGKIANRETSKRIPERQAVRWREEMELDSQAAGQST
ncbi:MAG: hypothetical protein ACQKBT_12230, partial [Puniceicoccales bacterium]